jgi:prepilin-type N-terminal cleavage/methylation domain-containing protein/prepilin-type processing-associated H-X9-DG protein
MDSRKFCVSDPSNVAAAGKALPRKAFTLVELLVVIAIIAVLLAVLMPSLTKAKEGARSAVCRSHLKQAGMSLHTYTADWDDWLAGLNTSGASMAAGHAAPDPSPSNSAVQTSDWISPTLGDMLGLPTGREQRFISICNTAFKCPSNKITYDFEYQGPFITSVPIQTVYTVSYSAAQAFHVYRGDSNPQGGPITDCDISYQATVPKDYVPKFSFIGTPASKIYVMDGSRYLEETPAGSGKYLMSINAASYQKQGGNYMLYGPPTQFAPGDPFLLTDYGKLVEHKLVDAAAPYGYRHSNMFNVAFFDGHSETLSVKDSLYIGYYWPKGSKVNHARSTYDVTAVNGQIIK